MSPRPKSAQILKQTPTKEVAMLGGQGMAGLRRYRAGRATGRSAKENVYAPAV